MESLLIIRNLKNELTKDFKIITNDNVLFLIYLKPFKNFMKKYDNYINLLIKCKKIYASLLNTIFIFIYNIQTGIELYDNFSLIMTNNNPEFFLKDLIDNIYNLEGLRLIAQKLNIDVIVDKRIKNAIDKFPYTLIDDINSRYHLYNLEFTDYSSRLRKIERLQLINKRNYFFYFKNNINYIEYIEHDINYMVVFYPEYKKELFLKFLKTI